MAEKLTFRDEAAALYDEAFAHVTAYFMPFLLRAAGVAPGMRVLDIATGTGLSAEAALGAVGPAGHVTAADVSPAMIAKARERLAHVPNVSISVEDGQALPFPDESFDAVLCNLGLMFFPDPVRGLIEFRRVLRRGGRVAVSVNTVVERSYNHQINLMIARYVPGLAESVARTFALAEASKLRQFFDEAGFCRFRDQYGKARLCAAVVRRLLRPLRARRLLDRSGAGRAFRGHPPRRTRRGAARSGRHWRAGQAASGVSNCQRTTLKRGRAARRNHAKGRFRRRAAGQKPGPCRSELLPLCGLRYVREAAVGHLILAHQ